MRTPRLRSGRIRAVDGRLLSLRSLTTVDPGLRLACRMASPTLARMNLQQQIDEDIKSAMKARETERLSVLRMLKAALKNAAIEKGGAEALLDDAETSAIVRKQVKQRQDSIEGFEKGNRPELAAKEKAEAEILTAYLPKALAESELEALVADAIAEAGATSKAQMGAVMKIVQAKAAGRADGRTLSGMVARILG